MKITDSQLYKYVPKAEKLWLSWLPTDKGDGFYEKVYSQAVLWLFLCHYMRVLSGDSRLCCGIA